MGAGKGPSLCAYCGRQGSGDESYRPEVAVEHDPGCPWVLTKGYPGRPPSAADHWEENLRLRAALARIMNPDQEPLRAALAKGHSVDIIHAVTAALNWCRDEAARALNAEPKPNDRPSGREG